MDRCGFSQENFFNGLVSERLDQLMFRPVGEQTGVDSARKTFFNGHVGEQPDHLIFRPGGKCTGVNLARKTFLMDRLVNSQTI